MYVSDDMLRDTLGKQLVEVCAGLVVIRRLEGRGDNVLHFRGGQQAATHGKPFVAALRDFGVIDDRHLLHSL